MSCASWPQLSLLAKSHADAIRCPAKTDKQSLAESTYGPISAGSYPLIRLYADGAQDITFTDGGRGEAIRREQGFGSYIGEIGCPGGTERVDRDATAKALMDGPGPGS